MQTISKTIIVVLLLCVGTTPIYTQCITDECGDIFADWALLSEQVTICEGATFEVINQTLFPDIDFYVWDWGNGERDTVYEVSNYFYTYLFEEGTACGGNDFIVYNISLEIYRFCDEGQSCHTQIAPVAIRFMPRADFTLPPIVCAGDSIAIGNGSCNGDDFYWDFGDGTTSTEQHPDHVFDSSGVYDVTLVVTNQCGTDSLSLPVEVLDKPVAGSSVNGSDLAIGCVPLTVVFDNFSQFSDTYSWSFSNTEGVVFLDTFNMNSVSPAVEFTIPGIYTVTMVATNDCGDNEWTTVVEVLEPPTVVLDTLPSGCDTLTLALGNYLTTTGDIDNYQWTVSGSSAITVPNEANPNVFFSLAGEYQITLEASNAHCPSATDNTVLFIQAPSGLGLELPTPGPICDASEPVSLTANPTGGNWLGVGVDGDGFFDPTAVGIGVYTLTYELADGACMLSDSLQLEVLAGEAVVTTPQVNVCENSMAVQLDFSPAGGSWSGEGISDPNLGIFDPALSGAGLFDLSYSYVDSNNCSISGQTLAEIQAIPQLLVPDTVAYCIDIDELLLQDELSPTATPSGGQFVWSGAFITDSLTGRFTSPGEGYYPVTLAYNLDLCAVETNTVIGIIDPDEAEAGPDQVVCISLGTTQLQGFPAGGQWTGPGVVSSFSGEVDLAIAGDGNHLYTYTIADGTSCQVSDITHLNIIGPDNLDAGSNLSFCQDDGLRNLPMPTPAGGDWSGPALIDPSIGLIDIDQLPADSTYWYNYSITNASTGCSFADSVGVVIHAIPTASFAVPAYNCTGTEFTLGTSPQADVDFEWLVDGIETLDGDSITINLSEPGTYAIQLNVISTAGCMSSTQEDLLISSAPVPTIALDNEVGCGPLSVQFADNSQGIDLSYEWAFGDGSSSTLADPSPVVYPAGIFDTVYIVQLTASNNCGSVTTEDSIVVRARPVADFGTQVSSGCSPLEISFANVTTGTADSYSWDLGNGQVWADSLPPNQIYSTPDTAATNYIITLIATNTCGSDSIQQEVLVQPNDVTPFFNADDTQGCQPLTVNFTNYSSYGATISWDFGDGITSAENDPSHTFIEPGYYTVYQYATTACSEDSTAINVEVLPGPDAMFMHPPDICPDQAVAFENLSSDYQTVFWDFGDGNVSTAHEPEHYYQSAGTFEIIMVISNTAYGCQSIHESEITVLQRPEASLSVDQLSGCPPLDVCFSAEATNADFYEWDFGDNNTTTTLNPCHAYETPGLYMAQLRAANELGCFSLADTVSIRVFDQPVAAFELPEAVLCGEEQTIVFNNTSTGANAYDWAFSNGLTSNLLMPEVNFSDTGAYQVDLMVSNTFSCQDQATASFRILPQPLADFAPILLDACAPQVVVFDNATLNSTNFYWNFGNGEMSTEAHPTVNYTEAGSYDVTLVASFDGLCYDSLQLRGSVDLLHRPTALFSWMTPSSAYDGFVQFTNGSTEAVSYLWDFGDGTFSEEESPLHDFQVNGNWETELLAIAANGCTDTATVAVTPDFMYNIFFPNALSPESGEGDVRLFKPVGIGLADWQLEIFSPWGQRVFVGDELLEDQPIAAWDGSYNGQILPQGAYAYKATVEYLNGVKRVYTGSVTLIR